jgi:hypothetical protein
MLAAGDVVAGNRHIEVIDAGRLLKDAISIPADDAIVEVGRPM